MTGGDDSFADLAEFRARLDGGVGQAARRSRPADWQFRDDEAIPDGWPGGAFAALATIHDDPWTDPAGPDAAIRAMTWQLGERREFLTTVLFSPATILDRLRQSCGTSAAGIVDAWIAMYWTSEAAFRAVTQAPPAGPSMAGDAGFLRPLAARVRFIVSSEPMRWRAQQDDGAWWARPQDLVLSNSGALGRAAGGSWIALVGRCQEARRDWIGCLDAYQSHPLLSQAKSPELEQELRALIFRHPGNRVPLGMSVRPLADAATLTAQDEAVIDEVTDLHLLPRFDLRSVIALAASDDTRARRVARTVIGAVAGGAGLAAVGCAAGLLVHEATWIAVGCYLLIGGGVLAFGTRWAAPFLLRLPAAAAVGIIALVSLLSGAGWLRTPPGGWAAAAALGAAACGYLAVELRNHAVAGWALLRALAVTAIGAVHAIMISLLGLVAVAPAFVSDGSGLSALWHRPGYGHAGMVLLLATAWCLAVGVFSQILWDDHPITAPLAHLSWRSQR